MFDAGKTRMIGLPYGEKNVTICMLSRFHLIPERNRRTDLLYQYRVSYISATAKNKGLQAAYVAF